MTASKGSFSLAVFLSCLLATLVGWAVVTGIVFFLFVLVGPCPKDDTPVTIARWSFVGWALLTPVYFFFTIRGSWRIASEPD